jgi:hypothetical protein
MTTRLAYLSRTSLLLSPVLILAVLTGCESGTKRASPEASKPAVQAQPKAPMPYTAKPCFDRMTDLAQRWTADAVPFHVESELNSESNGQAGRATVWRGMFASPGRRTMRTFICSGSRLAEAPPYGVTSTAETAYPPSVTGLAFIPSYLQADSDKAFAEAQKHGGAALLKKDPNQPVLYMLEWDPKAKLLLWYVVFGKSQSDSKGIGVINATTGAFVRAK